MQWRTRIAWSWTLAVLALAAWGCQRMGVPERAKRPKEETTSGTTALLKQTPAASKNVPAEPVKPPQPPKKEIPKVRMPTQLLETCLVKDGDLMPEGQLPDLDGQPHTLQSVLGSRLTVVLFWESTNPYAVQALRRLVGDVVEPYAEKGVRVIGINRGQPADTVRKTLEDQQARYLNLLDADGAYFAKVATGQLPRVYLLDHAGRILWFDVEYSDTTRRSLREGIEAVLAQEP